MVNRLFTNAGSLRNRRLALLTARSLAGKWQNHKAGRQVSTGASNVRQIESICSSFVPIPILNVQKPLAHVAFNPLAHVARAIIIRCQC